jgi:Sugar (and other) transporter
MIVQITPIAINQIGWQTYIIFAVLNATWVPIIYVFFPETKGLELEAVDRLFSGDALLPDEQYEDKIPAESMAEDGKSHDFRV